MVEKTKTLDELVSELKKVVEGLPSPSIGLIYEDKDTSGICRVLTLRTTKTIESPLRALQLTPYPTSEGRLIGSLQYQNFCDIYYRFNEERFDSFVDSIKDETGVPDYLKNYVEPQIKQAGDSFRLINFEIASGVDYGEPEEKSYKELIRQIGKWNSDILVPPIPRDVTETDSIMSFVLSAAKVDKSLTNPMVIGGYIPPCSSKTACELIESFLEAGIKVFIIDLRGRKINSKPFSYLASLSIASKDSPIYVHGLHVNPVHKRQPLDIVYDLLSPTFGINSFSNLRWVGGGGKPSKDTLRIKCVHKYVTPKLSKIKKGGYSCQECNTENLKNEYDDLTYIDFKKKLSRYAVKSSTEELILFKNRIKEDGMRSYLKEKEYLEDEIRIMEKYINKSSLELKHKSTKQRTLKEMINDGS